MAGRAFIWVNKRDWRRPGPIVAMTLRSAHALAGLGCETHLVVGAGPETDTERDIADFYGLPRRSLLSVHRVKKRRLFGAELSASVYGRAVDLAKMLARDREVAVITRDPGFLPALAGLRAGTSRIQTYYEPHDYFADLSWLGRRPKFAEMRHGWLERRYLPKISGLLCIAGGQNELYQKCFPGISSTWIPLGCDPVPPADAEARRALRRAVYIGHLHGSKGLIAILTAAERIKRKGHQANFSILGGTAEQVARYRKLVEEKGVADMVDFDPFVSPSEMHRRLHDGFSIGVAPLRADFYNENLTCPVKVLDYLSHGLPVISSPVRSVRDLADDAARVADPRHSSLLTDAILEVLDSRELYAKLSEAAQRRAHELSWPSRAAKIAEFCAEH